MGSMDLVASWVFYIISYILILSGKIYEEELGLVFGFILLLGFLLTMYSSFRISLLIDTKQLKIILIALHLVVWWMFMAKIISPILLTPFNMGFLLPVLLTIGNLTFLLPQLTIPYENLDVNKNKVSIGKAIILLSLGLGLLTLVIGWSVWVYGVVLIVFLMGLIMILKNK